MKRKFMRQVGVSALLVLASMFAVGCGATTGAPPPPDVQASQHSVSLSWNRDASTVQGYYVYRRGQTGGPYTKISALLPGTTYTDSTVTSGQTYYYVVTALGTNSVESGYSNQATAPVP